MRFLRTWFMTILCLIPLTLLATNKIPLSGIPTNAKAAHINNPTVIPKAPDLPVKGYILLDAASGDIIANNNADMRLAPASLTKIMTLYVISNALKTGQANLDDAVHVSEKAWRTGGSRMFIKVDTKVPVKELLQGIIVASGNDACVALSEHIAGTEKSFADLMNQTAQSLGMNSSHFVDSTGLPNANHYTTPKDLAILAQALIRDFPDNYHWYKQKWFTYNGIKQPNRNRLLWRDDSVDGIKTGHTDAAGYCLVASAERGNMRLIAVVMGAKSDTARANNTEAMLNYGFRFFETKHLYAQDQELDTPRIWKGETKTTPMGVQHDIIVTIPKGHEAKLKTEIVLNDNLEAPIVKDQVYGHLVVSLDGKELANQPLVALSDNPRGGIWARTRDSIVRMFHHWMS